MGDLSENRTRISNQLNNAEIEIDDRIVGLPEWESEEICDMKEMIVQFSENHLKLSDLNLDDNEEVNRMGQKNIVKPRNIIINFKDRVVRNKFYYHRGNLYDNKTNRTSTEMYINEDPTKHRQWLYYDTRKLQNRATTHAVWTTSGTVMVKLEESSTRVPIKTHGELANLLCKNNVEV